MVMVPSALTYHLLSWPRIRTMISHKFTTAAFAQSRRLLLLSHAHRVGQPSQSIWPSFAPETGLQKGRLSREQWLSSSPWKNTTSLLAVHGVCLSLKSAMRTRSQAPFNFQPCPPSASFAWFLIYTTLPSEPDPWNLPRGPGVSHGLSPPGPPQVPSSPWLSTLFGAHLRPVLLYSKSPQSTPTAKLGTAALQKMRGRCVAQSHRGDFVLFRPCASARELPSAGTTGHYSSPAARDWPMVSCF